ncbi:hypothetical protein Tco_0674813 [Tanacetum coccineum]
MMGRELEGLSYKELDNLEPGLHDGMLAPQLSIQKETTETFLIEPLTQAEYKAATPHRNSSLSSYPNKRARQLVWDHPDSQVFFQPPIGQVGLGEQQVTGTIVAAITRSFLEMAR